MLSISPTNPRFISFPFLLYFFLLHFIKPPSLPDIPTAVFPCLLRKDTIFVFISPIRTIFTISIVSLSVTLNPSTNSGFIPFSNAISLICFPPPCISTTFIPTYFIRIRSLRTLSSILSFSIMLPPILTTTTLLKYSFM